VNAAPDRTGILKELTGKAASLSARSASQNSFATQSEKEQSPPLRYQATRRVHLKLSSTVIGVSDRERLHNQVRDRIGL
jgi:hypothetical protein